MQISEDIEHWAAIGTAPRDGSIVRVAWSYDGVIQEWFTMRWDDSQTNGLFPDVKGMWVAPNGSFTWNEADAEGAPTHWQPITQQETN